MTHLTALEPFQRHYKSQLAFFFFPFFKINKSQMTERRTLESYISETSVAQFTKPVLN